MQNIQKQKKIRTKSRKKEDTGLYASKSPSTTQSPNLRHPPTTKPLQRHIRQNLSALTLQWILTRLHGNRALSHLLVPRQRVFRAEVLVNNPTHALLAMIAIRLTAIVPNGLHILYHKRENILCLAGRGVEVEARENGVRATERRAWGAEAGLCEGVRFGQEVEFHHVAWGGDDVFRLEVEATVGGGGAGVDAVRYACCADAGGGDCAGEGEDEGCCEGEDGGDGEHRGCLGWVGLGKREFR